MNNLLPPYISLDWTMKDGIYKQYSAWKEELPCKSSTGIGGPFFREFPVRTIIAGRDPGFPLVSKMRNLPK